MHLTWKTDLNKGTRATRWMWAGGESTGNNSLLAEAFLFWELEGCAEWTKYVYFGKAILCLESLEKHNTKNSSEHIF